MLCVCAIHFSFLVQVACLFYLSCALSVIFCSLSFYSASRVMLDRVELCCHCIQQFQFTLSDQSLKPTRQDRRGIWDLNE